MAFRSLAATAILVVLCAIAAPGSGMAESGPPEGSERVSLVLQWNHQSQFAGYYMALEKGFYRRAGLDVRIVQGGADVRPDRLLEEGRVDFASIMLPTALELRQAGLPLRLLAQLVNRGNFMLVAWKRPDDNAVPIAQASDLNGHRVTVWSRDFRTPYLAFFRAWGVTPEILPQYYTLSLFLHHGAAACSAMRYNEYHTLLQSGVSPGDLTVFNLWELGVNLPEDGLYCLADTWRQRPDVCRRFVRASLAGWQYAREHRQETLDVVMGYIRRENLPTNRPHMAWMLDEILQSIFPGSDAAWAFGRLGRQAYRQAGDLLLRQGRIAAFPSYESFVITEAHDVAP